MNLVFLGINEELVAVGSENSTVTIAFADLADCGR